MEDVYKRQMMVSVDMVYVDLDIVIDREDMVALVMEVAVMVVMVVVMVVEVPW